MSDSQSVQYPAFISSSRNLRFTLTLISNQNLKTTTLLSLSWTQQMSLSVQVFILLQLISDVLQKVVDLSNPVPVSLHLSLQDPRNKALFGVTDPCYDVVFLKGNGDVNSVGNGNH